MLGMGITPGWVRSISLYSGALEQIRWLTLISFQKRTTSPITFGLENLPYFFFCIFFWRARVCRPLYVAHLWFLRDVWIRTQSTAVASWRATDLATHPSNLATHSSNLATHPSAFSHPSLYLATHPSTILIGAANRKVYKKEKCGEQLAAPCLFAWTLPF